MSSGKKWDTVATHIHRRCSSVHLERGKINHTLQKDKSPGAVAPSKQEREGGFQGGSNTVEIEKKQTAERIKKKFKKESPDLTKTCLKKRSLVLMVGFVERLQPAGRKFPHIQAEPAGVLENPQTSFFSYCML